MGTSTKKKTRHCSEVMYHVTTHYTIIILIRYISDPYLINGSKFDLRLYVYISSIDPLIIYIYRDGLVRFATRRYCYPIDLILSYINRYSPAKKTLNNKFVHLTNYSINKKSSEFMPNLDETLCIGHKW